MSSQVGVGHALLPDHALASLQLPQHGRLRLQSISAATQIQPCSIILHPITSTSSNAQPGQHGLEQVEAKRILAAWLAAQASHAGDPEEHVPVQSGTVIEVTPAEATAESRQARLVSLLLSVMMSNSSFDVHCVQCLVEIGHDSHSGLLLYNNFCDVFQARYEVELRQAPSVRQSPGASFALLTARAFSSSSAPAVSFGSRVAVSSWQGAGQSQQDLQQQQQQHTVMLGRSPTLHKAAQQALQCLVPLLAFPCRCNLLNLHMLAVHLL